MHIVLDKSMPMCGWTPQLELRLQAITDGKISLGKKPTKEMLAGFHVTRRCCNGAKLYGWVGNEIPVRRVQTNPERVMLLADTIALQRPETVHQWFWRCEFWW